MTNRVDKLEHKGRVRRSPDESDRRGVIVTMTTKGKNIIDAVIQHRLDVADVSLGGITKKERKELAALLRKVRLTGAGELPQGLARDRTLLVRSR